ncbi:MAG: metallophosphoesterase [Legionella sp.]|uniref:metallophosphoesterase n=1 Tax=Legionella sp. TaxID=459 RepID=UPI0039E5249F
MSFVIRMMLLILLFCSFAHATTQFLTISDIHYGLENTDKDGQDTGPEFLKITWNKLNELSKNVDFLLFLGDIPSHSFFIDPHLRDYEKTIFQGLYQNDADAKPLFYVPGNNDSLQGNYQPFETEGISPLNYAKDWNGACAHCAGLIIDGSHMYHDGYYSSYVLPQSKDIMLIALNATQWTRIPWLKRTFFSKYRNQEKDARAQFEWLEQQLKNHSAKQLLIAVHEPPGLTYLGEPMWYPQYTRQFIALLSKYHKLYGQISVLSAHTHMEEFRRLQLTDGSFIYVYSTPGISRNHHNYPGMKVFRVNDTLQFSNFTTYYTSNLHTWNNEHYQALGVSNAIFPDCQHKTLAQCLDGLNVNQVCEDLDRGAFYGVKSPRVKNTACRKTYPVN